MTENTQSNGAAQDSNAPAFSIQRIYVKDASFETPHSPQIFRGEWQPQVNIELQTTSNQIDPGVYEVIMSVTATAKVKDKVAFIAEVKQAGIFLANNFATEQLGPVLGIVCPNILFPYARETISSFVVRGSFPQLNIEPVNFEALYMQQLEQQKGGSAGTSTARNGDAGATDTQTH